jgi:hypothetical protein
MCAQATSSQRFVLERDRQHFELVIPAPSAHASVAAAEEIRRRTRAGAVTYVLAVVDNRSGSGTAVLPHVTVETPSGSAVPLEPAAAALDRWLGDDAGQETRALADRLLASLPAQGDNELAVLEGQRVETLLIAQEPIEKIARVSASPRLGKLILPGGPLVFELVPP